VISSSTGKISTAARRSKPYSNANTPCTLIAGLLALPEVVDSQLLKRTGGRFDSQRDE
jgi:hypothetical protein